MGGTDVEYVQSRGLQNLPFDRTRRTDMSRGLCRAICGLLLAIAGLAAGARAEEDYQTVLGVVYAEHGGEKLEADLFLPAASEPVPGVLVVHGGGWMVGSRDSLRGVAEKLARSGLAAVAISYRKAPLHKFPAQLEDCRAAVRWMRANAERYNIDPERISGLGYSAGGHLVMLLAAIEAAAGSEEASGDRPTEPSAKLQAVVAGGAPSDFRIYPSDGSRLEYWLGASREENPAIYRQASPLSFVTRHAPPMFLYHGERDRVVPMISSIAMLTALRLAGADARFHKVAGRGHIGAALDSEAADAAVAFLKSVLLTPNENSPNQKPRQQSSRQSSTASGHSRPLAGSAP